ncbi:hypothetical protein AAFN86_08445 [Roseomonas sp. CAU 1739]|uniref:COG4223 family protein n=1 Tax=Roseomonas sp. CAU 1739 TaxID=3140364 RepID=UPI00325C138D
MRCLGGGAAATLLLAGLLVVPLHGQGQSLSPGAAGTRPVEVRPPPASLDLRVRRLEESLSAIDERLRAAGAAGMPIDRLALALLHLETVVGNGRPWSREWQLILALDGAALVPPLYLEVLGSHASRGLPSARELTERFEALAPAIASRASSEVAFLERSLNMIRSTLAGIGLAAPVEPGQVETVLASIREHLRRGELPGALAEVTTLAEEQQALLAGWLAQVRARVAVEQSLQEAILGLLSGRARQG